MPETILLACLFAKIKGYEIKPLFKSWTIYPLVIFEIITLIGQVATFFGNYKIIEFIGSLTTIYLISYLLLVLKYELYVTSIIGSFFVVFGGVLNDIAIKSNGGFMPVYQSLSYLTGRVTLENYQRVNDIHILGDSQTNFKILTDFIDLGYTILSVGDVFIRVFVFIILYYAIKKVNNQRRKEIVKINRI
ncbi:hypothetical protein FDB55_12020 [Clostridium botulinum]|uniref:DUF5317 domain-containing protein n=1 Tax=Clostridium botulinum TaxID=1491 RepID=A0A0C2N936_CLOBO|nr:DUF5317 family protein [Clostridium botulinum]ACD53078.1 putative membrane protein [Clostridium botulinum E3 str. Alaska E43]AJF29352.1 membrane protein [Clostridium botulinum]AJF32413.1 membrane protein [Clostridium botulinum]KAI3347181.1 DUF5317 domain-containing protein [Clostridium botulinum]KIL09585.1 membrane protein [Clostridium botulinum]